MKFLSGLIFLSVVYFCSLKGQVSDSVKYLSLDPHDFKNAFTRTDSSILIDVREPFEFSGKHIRDAINIPSSGNLERAADTLNKNYSYFLYCTSGYRSSKAAGKLFESGFHKLYNLEGGINAWKKKGMPLVKGRKKKK